MCREQRGGPSGSRPERGPAPLMIRADVFDAELSRGSVRPNWIPSQAQVPVPYVLGSRLARVCRRPCGVAINTLVDLIHSAGESPNFSAGPIRHHSLQSDVADSAPARARPDNIRVQKSQCQPQILCRRRLRPGRHHFNRQKLPAPVVEGLPPPQPRPGPLPSDSEAQQARPPTTEGIRVPRIVDDAGTLSRKDARLVGRWFDVSTLIIILTHHWQWHEDPSLSTH